MLKKHERIDIIASGMRWNLMNQNVLVSTAMISALWEKHNKDTLDLMLPFLKYSIAKTSKVGARLNINAVIAVFKEEFGYDSIPYNVVITMLNRLSPSILSRKDREYSLISPLDSEYADFERRKTIYKDHRNSVGSALADYLNENTVSQSKPYDIESALMVLIDFFVANGLIIAQTPEQLTLLKNSREGKINYCIGRFLINEHKNESVIFDYVTDMVKGFFVSTAISFQPENLSLPHASLKNLHCYLDTRVILSALGLRLPTAKTAALELLEMLRNEQAVICCFEHTVTEIREIICAYKKSLLNPDSKDVYNTLEYWDEQNYSVEQVNRYLSILKQRIESLGINIIPSPTDIYRPVKGIKLNKFKDTLTKRVRYNTASAWKNDVLSVLGIMKLRKGLTSHELEKCDHIFVTTNTPLIKVVNKCLFEPDAGVSPVITDITLSSLVWFKCSSSHSNYPAHKIVENAMLALEPTHSFLNDFYEAINQLQAEGGITKEEAAIIRSDIQIRRDLFSGIKGDSSGLGKETIAGLRDRLREQYEGENKQQSEENYKLYLEQKARNDNTLLIIANEIENCGEYWKDKTAKILNKCARGLLIIILLLFIGLAIAGFIISRDYWFGAIAMLLADIAGFYDLLKGKRQLIRSFIGRVSEWVAEKARNIKRRNYSSVIESLSKNKVE